MNELENLTAIFNVFKAEITDKEEDIKQNFPIIWKYDNGKTFTALLFFMRSCQADYKSLPKGRGEKMLSYYMIMWMLKNHKDVFLNNYSTYIEKMGYYKDCLSLAQMAKNRGHCVNDIYTLLTPLAIALTRDENEIIKNHLNGKPPPLVSLAAKWAPRKGKKFSDLIPFLKELCNIKGKNSDLKWRKYIQQISNGHSVKNIEYLLSSGNYNRISLEYVPSKALELYKSVLMENKITQNSYNNFIRNREIKKIKNPSHVSNLLIDYIQQLKHNNIICKNVLLENDWSYFINNTNNESKNVNIPMINISDVLLKNEYACKIALSMAIIMSHCNKGIFNNKLISHNSNPKLFSIFGNCLSEQINNIMEITNKDYYLGTVDYVQAYDEVLEYLVYNKINPVNARNLRIIIITSHDFKDDDCEWYINHLEYIRMRYEKYGYTPPKFIFWNLSGKLFYDLVQFTDTDITYLEGCHPHLLETFIETGELDMLKLPISILEKYKKIVV
jgi:hypothetical protein